MMSPASPPRPIISIFPPSVVVPAMNESAEANPAVDACFSIVSTATAPGSHMARRCALPLALRLPRMTSNSPVHSSPLPPG